MKIKSLYTEEFLIAVHSWNGKPGAPSIESRKKPNGLRVFKSSILENLIARAHPLLPGLWVLPLVLFLASWGLEFHNAWRFVGLVSLGVLLWTLLEYGLHIIWFHRDVTSSDENRKLTQFVIHGYHHEFPNDPWRLVMPPVIAWPIGIFVASIVWLTVGPEYFFGLYTGILLGYLGYDWTHYYTHHFRPKGGIGRYLREFHMIHHFSRPDRNMGLSSPLWDWVFGMAVEPKVKKDRQREMLKENEV